MRPVILLGLVMSLCDTPWSSSAEDAPARAQATPPRVASPPTRNQANPGHDGADADDIAGDDIAGAADVQDAGDAKVAWPTLRVPVDPSEVGPRRCLRLLRRTGARFEQVSGRRANVRTPLRALVLPGGIPVTFQGHRRRRALHEVIDCRLALALAYWAPVLQAEGVTHLEHFSVYRPHARVASTGRPSGHAAALAVDAAIFHLDPAHVAASAPPDESDDEAAAPDEDPTLEVMRDWSDKRIGAPACDARAEEPAEQAALRRMVCAAWAAELFEIVITPHGNADHDNHVHLELRPGVSWHLLE